MKDILSLYQEHCTRHGVPYERHESVLSYDDTTLFCPAGMQQYKSSYHDPGSTGTRGNCQSCLRLVDLSDIDDSTHYLHFNMLGLFSFHGWSVPQTIDFWISFLHQELGLQLDYVTVHPDCYESWRSYYQPYGLEVRPDEECVWGDGELRGYCTEFYIDDVEIGNIVNTGGHSIDVGFGLERLQQFVQPGTESKTGEQVLTGTIERLLRDGIVPGNKRHGYVLRKLMRLLLKRGGTYPHPLFEQERTKLDRMVVEYHRHKDRYRDKSPEWWLDTFGVDVTALTS